jgi:hypothetical protein
MGECLILNGNPASRGYRAICWRSKKHLAHRVVYREWHGEIPDGYVVDHICHNEAAHRGECPGGETCIHRACVNPAHLRVVTNQENRRASPLSTFGRPSYGLSTELGKQTHCLRGHEFTLENTHVQKPPDPRGAPRRVCRQCRKETSRVKYTDNIGRGLRSDGNPRKRTEPVSREATHCPSGHLYTSDTTYIRKRQSGGKVCRTCQNEKARQKRAKGI